MKFTMTHLNIWILFTTSNGKLEAFPKSHWQTTSYLDANNMLYFTCESVGWNYIRKARIEKNNTQCNFNILGQIIGKQFLSQNILKECLRLLEENLRWNSLEKQW